MVQYHSFGISFPLTGDINIIKLAYRRQEILLGVALAQLDQDVLAIDLTGRQGDLGKHLGVYDEYAEQIVADEAWRNISMVFDEAWPTIAEKLRDRAVEDLILETAEGVDLIPAHPGLDSLDADLGNVDDAHERYTRLEGFLNEYVEPLGYDVVLIDPPGLTNNVAYDGLWAATNVIASVGEPFEAEQASALREDLEKIADTFDAEVSLSLVLPNKIDTARTLADEYLAAFEEEYPDAIAPDVVPYSQDIRNATERGHTAYVLDDPSTTAQRARGAVRDHATQYL